MSPAAFGLVLALAAATTPAALEQMFQDGIRAYDAQDWDGAIEAWEGLARFRVEHPAVEYNLGNAYLRRQDYGRAVLHWERALRLDPSDVETRENLKLVRDLLVDDVGPEAQGLARVIEEIERRVPIEVSAATSLGAWHTLGLALLVAILRPGAARRAALGLAALAVATLALCGPLLLRQIRAAEDRSRFVVLAEAAEARSGPGEHYTTTFIVHEGLVVRGRESAQGWERVRLPNGLDGWIRAEALGRI